MAGRTKHAQRSKYSYHQSKPFNQFAATAYSRAVVKENKSLGQILANALNKVFKKKKTTDKEGK